MKELMVRRFVSRVFGNKVFHGDALLVFKCGMSHQRASGDCKGLKKATNAILKSH